MPGHDVSIRGEGPVGRALALALARQGLRVALVGAGAAAGAAAPAGPDVRAYALNAASVALLQGLKVWDALPADARCAVQEMRIRGDAPGAVLHFSAWEQAVAELAWIVDAAELDAALATAVRFSPHVERLNLEPQAPLRVLAEGRDSAGRASLGVQVSAHAYGHSGVAARLEGDLPHAGVAHQWFRSPEVLALLPFDQPAAGRSWGLVWAVPQSRAAGLLALDDAGFEQALAEATQGVAGTLRLRGARAAWPLRLSQSSPVCGPGWALVGDAAHVVHPLAGQGLNLGLADVAALAAVIAAREPWRSLGDEKLLRRYARARRGATQAMAALTDALWQLFAAPDPALRLLRNQGLAWLDRLGPVKKALAARAFGGPGSARNPDA